MGKFLRWLATIVVTSAVFVVALFATRGVITIDFDIVLPRLATFAVDAVIVIAVEAVGLSAVVVRELRRAGLQTAHLRVATANDTPLSWWHQVLVFVLIILPMAVIEGLGQFFKPPNSPPPVGGYAQGENPKPGPGMDKKGQVR